MPMPEKARQRAGVHGLEFDLEIPPDDEHEHARICGRNLPSFAEIVPEVPQPRWLQCHQQSKEPKRDGCSPKGDVPASPRPVRAAHTPSGAGSPASGGNSPMVVVVDSPKKKEKEEERPPQPGCTECKRGKDAKTRLLKYYPPPVGESKVRVDVIDDEAEMLIIRRANQPSCRLHKQILRC